VEQLDRPELKDVPFAVGGGVLTTCNYLARKFGCRSGMAGFVAKKLCPELLMIKPNFEKYTAKAHEVREILADYDPRFESASIDEAYLNITEYCEEKHMDPAAAVDQMRREIHQKTNITVSAGIAANAKLAKICSNMNKPNGQFVLPNDRTAIMAFMRDLPTRKVNGVGRVLERELLEIGVRTCGDIYALRQYLFELFGEKTFDFLISVYLGLGRTRIQPAEDYERKSVGTESTFHEMSDSTQFKEKLRWTADELEKDMKRAECKGRTLCLKIKLHTFEVFTRQVVTPRAVCLADDLYNFSLPMLVRLEQDMPGMKLRLMGLRCTHLVSTKRPDTMAFFGLRPRRSESAEPETSGRKRKISGEFEVSDNEQAWPADSEWGDFPDECLPRGLEHEDHNLDLEYRRHGKEITANPKRGDPAIPKDEEWWDCPICSRPQAASERLFNEHIDLCLSRQTIREAVHEDGAAQMQGRPREATPDAKRVRIGEKKKGRQSTNAAIDPKQKRLFFG
jgi:DNA polymerase kappa